MSPMPSVCRRMAVGAVAACTLMAAFGLFPAAGVASADCTTAGDFGAGAGCSPPGASSGGGNSEAWPPTAVDWPPSQDSASGDSGGGDGGGGKGGGDKPTPIVMPDGSQPALGVHTSGSDSSGTTSTPTPIVGATTSSGGSSQSTSTTPTPIVVPTPAGRG
jgi:hypothetical protein